MDCVTEQLRKLGVDERWPEATNDSSARQQSGGADMSPRHYLLNLYRRPSTYS
jgi:hypothetical protein